MNDQPVTPQPDEDVEGHGLLPMDRSLDDDVEGHGLLPMDRVLEDDDVEGHVNFINPEGPEDSA